MERFNEWWFSGSIRKDLALSFKRHDFPRVMENLKGRQILLVAGPRRVGKTTLMYQVIEKLLETVDPNKILYFSFDESSVNPKEVLKFYEKKILMKPFEEVGKAFVFLMKFSMLIIGPRFLSSFTIYILT